MDINIRIIEGVKQSPCLRSNNGNLDDRNRSWMELAEKFGMDEQFLKIRWHSLLQGYQRDANFKYAKWMYFMCRNTESKGKENWPEFIITEEYIKNDNPEEQEQFVLLDSDEEENHSKILKSPKEREFNFKETSKQLETFPKKEFNNQDQDKPDAEKEIEIADASSNRSSSDLEIISSPNPKQCHVSSATTLNVEEKMAAVDVNKENKICIQNSKEMLYAKSQPVIAERCEDVIFGELVSAMLKRMDESKKKNTKREIMNLLFS